MTSDHQAKIEELLDEASFLDFGPTKIALLEEAVRLADTHGDVDFGFAARDEYIQACTFGGHPERSLVAFCWCLSQCDRNPQRFVEEDILWKYKWVMDGLGGFPQIARSQIDEMFADMARRFQRAGAGERAIAKLRCDVAMDMGEYQAAQQYEQQWQRSPRDWLSDCHACDVDLHIDYYVFMNDDERALSEARQILLGSLRCAEVPHRTHARLLLPCFRLGRLAEAMKHHKQGYRMISKNQKFLKQIARHLLVLTLTDNLDRASKLFQKHLPWTFAMLDLSQRYEFFLPALFLLERLGNRRAISLRLPRDVPVYREEGKYAIGELIGWLEGELRDLAERFDRRNGTDYYATRLAERSKYHDLVKPFRYERGQE